MNTLRISELPLAGALQPSMQLPGEAGTETRRFPLQDAAEWMINASLAYGPVGAGAFRRTLRQRLSDSISVEDFGAVGDGLTDDAPAIRVALDAAANFGGTVRFGPRRYRMQVGAGIVVPPGVTLDGVRGKTMLLPVSTLANAVGLDVSGGAALETTAAGNQNLPPLVDQFSLLALTPFTTGDAADRLAYVDIADDFSGLGGCYWSAGEFGAPQSDALPLMFPIVAPIDTVSGINASKYRVGSFAPIRGVTISNLMVDAQGLTGTGFCHGIRIGWADACLVENVLVRNATRGAALLAERGTNNVFRNVAAINSGTQQYNDIALYRQCGAEAGALLSRRASGFGPGVYYSSFYTVRGVVSQRAQSRGLKFAGNRYGAASGLVAHLYGSTGLAISQGTSFCTFDGVQTLNRNAISGGRPTAGNATGVWFADQNCRGNVLGGVISHGNPEYAVDVGPSDTGNTITMRGSAGVAAVRNPGGAIITNDAVPAPAGFGYMPGAGQQGLEVVAGGVASAGATLRPSGGAADERLVLAGKGSGDVWLSPRGVLTAFVQGVAGAPDYLWLRGGTGAVRIDALGSSANVDLVLAPRGGGSVRVGSAITVERGTAGPPLVLTSNAQGQLVTGLRAASADALTTPRSMAIAGDAAGSTSFDGTADRTITLTLANSGVAPGSYTSVTVDAKGRVTAGGSPLIYTPGAGAQVLEVAAGSSGSGLTLRPAGGAADERLVLAGKGSGDVWLSPRGVLTAFVQGVAGAPDYLWLRGGTGAVRIDALGSSANVDLVLAPRGTGRTRIAGPAQFTTAIGSAFTPDANSTWTVDFPSATQLRFNVRDGSGVIRQATLTLS